MARGYLRLLQKAELYILDEIDRICTKHNIHFFLTGGSMLGAVRHQGFIPWDDDIDVGMYIDEYNKFLDIAPDELGPEFFLDSASTDDDYALVFSKVRLLGTVFIEEKGNPQSAHNEIFVDILPFINLSSNKRQRILNAVKLTIFSEILLSKCGYKVWKGGGIRKRIKFLPVDIMARVFSTRRLRSMIESISNRYLERTGIVCPHNGSKWGYLRWNMPYDVIQNLIRVRFENRMMPIPVKSDEFLSIVYGDDYMKLPPENKRITHRPIEINLGNYIFE